MTAEVNSGTGVSKRRPKDRKKQIADNAAALFAEHGFHKVRMEDIAQASGITDRALYRHYENKQALLAHVVNIGQAAYERALSDSGAESDAVGKGVIRELLRGLVTAALDTRELAVLWAREARYLPAADLAVIRERVAGGAARIVDRLSDAKPDLPRPAAELRARAVLGVLASPSHHRRSISRDEFEVLLRSACEACLEAKTVGRLEPVAHSGAWVQVQMSSRREQLLASAAAAFRRSGYMAVGIDDIGRPLGIVGPALYRYFPTKLDILVSLSRRIDEWLTLETLRALRVGPDPAMVLRTLVTGYVRVAVDDPDLIAVAAMESLHLPEDVLASLQRTADGRTAEWLACLAAVRPELSEVKARLLIAAVTGLVDDTVRIPHILGRTDVDRELTEIGLAVLLDTTI